MSETSKAHPRRLNDGFYGFCRGAILDVGYAGTGGETMPGCNVLGVDLGYPGYNGLNLPFPDASFDTVYSSHMLEHVVDDLAHMREHWRCVKPGGHLIIYLPHQWLYEKKAALPSQYNLDHKRFYTPAVILTKLEQAIPIRSYRLRRCMDCDAGFNYSIPDNVHSEGEFAIEVIAEKLR